MGYLAGWLQTNLINSLSNTEEIKVRQSETINGLLDSQGIENYASLTPTIARNISRKLETDMFVYGNITQSGDIYSSECTINRIENRRGY